MLSRRLGSFFVTKQRLLDTESMLALMAYMFVVRCEFLYSLDGMMYVACSPFFDEVPEAVIQPEYQVVFLKPYAGQVVVRIRKKRPDEVAVETDAVPSDGPYAYRYHTLIHRKIAGLEHAEPLPCLRADGTAYTGTQYVWVSEEDARNHVRYNYAQLPCAGVPVRPEMREADLLGDHIAVHSSSPVQRPEEG